MFVCLSVFPHNLRILLEVGTVMFMVIYKGIVAKSPTLVKEVKLSMYMYVHV